MSETERLAKLEVTQTQVATELKTIHQHIEKITDTNTRHLEKTNESFHEVGKSLALLASTVADLKETTKDLIDGQQKVLSQISLIDAQNKQISSLQSEVNSIKDKLGVLERLELKIQGGWKAVAVMTTIITFVISTAISIGAFKLGQSSYTPSLQSPVHIEQMIEKSQPRGK